MAPLGGDENGAALESICIRTLVFQTHTQFIHEQPMSLLSHMNGRLVLLFFRHRPANQQPDTLSSPHLARNAAPAKAKTVQR